MKNIIQNIKSRLLIGTALSLLMLILSSSLMAQTDSVAATPETQTIKHVKPVKNTFYSPFIIDNQSVMVPVKGAIEMVIQHRFGTINNGYKDMWGLFAPSNMRLGVTYSPIKNLSVGGGLTKYNLTWDIEAKYAIIKQTPGKYPVSITYYANMDFDTRENVDSSLFKYNSQRYAFFNQIIIARKINERLSVQVAPSISHQNAVSGFYTKKDSTGTSTFQRMKFDHFAVAVSAKYSITPNTALIVDYNQPLTKHNTNNPCPSLSFGAEMHTSGHTFQIFFTNYYFLSPQQNNLYNQNAPFTYTKDAAGTTVQGGKFLLGFNITRLW
ncbi:hypothetical protein GALL_129080 [mine drainage metagenome]|uniref:DUF5777 domain-containing protein n=1 Tax=mine drainage metagenome TaxID=410659 RepID=A0A1J5STZ7_9ZZZZ